MQNSTFLSVIQSCMNQTVYKYKRWETFGKESKNNIVHPKLFNLTRKIILSSFVISGLKPAPELLTRKAVARETEVSSNVRKFATGPSLGTV